MEHRHIHPARLSLAAIDDIIDRDGLADWFQLFDLARSEPAIADAVRHIALHGAEHAEASNRYSAWIAILDHCTSTIEAGLA